MRKIVITGLVVAVFAAACIPYLGCGDFGLNACDDYAYVLGEVAGGITVDGVIRAFTRLENAIWMPLTWISYMVDYSAFGGDFGAMHLHSVVIHGLDAVLLWWFLWRLVRIKSEANGGGVHGALAAFVAALVWALHPLRVESVTWLSSRKDVLSMFFLLGALHGWLSFRAAMKDVERRVGYALSLLAVVMGAMCKPSVMVYPGLVLVLDWLILGQVVVGVKDGRLLLLAPKQWKPLIAPVVLGVLVAVEGTVVQRTGGALGANGMTLGGTVLNAVAAFGLYVWHTIWPFDLAVDCVPKYQTLPRGIMTGVAAVIIAGGCFWYRLRKIAQDGGAVRAPVWGLAGAVWFCGALLPFMANFGIHVQADRFTYIPSVGVSLALVGLLSGKSRGVQIARTAAIPVLVGLAALTWRQNSFWRDDRVLYKHTLAVDGDDNFFAHNILGVWHWNVGHDLKKAVAHFDRAAEIKHDLVCDFDNVYVLALAEAGQLERAEAVLDEMKERYWAEKEALEMRGETSERKTLPLELLQARAACLMARTNTLQSAAEELAEIHGRDADAVLTLYLKGRIAWLEDRKGEAVKFWRRMLDKKNEYVTSAFVRKYVDEFMVEQTK